MVKCVVVADDLTGANATGVLLKKYNLETASLLNMNNFDIKKFNFNSDQEFLELSEEDREEIEVNIQLDTNLLNRKHANKKNALKIEKVIFNDKVISGNAITAFDVNKGGTLDIYLK